MGLPLPAADTSYHHQTGIMGNPTVILHDSFKDPQAEIWFIEPPGFTALPLDALLPEPGSPAAEQLRAVAAPFLESAPNEMLRQRFIANFASAQQLLGALVQSGIVHCSMGLHHDDADEAGADSGQPMMSWFTISWLEAAVAPRGVTAARAAMSAGGRSHVEYVELPCGPATLTESTVVPKADSGFPQQRVLQVHAYLPHPDCMRLAVLTLSTSAVARREEYRAMLRQIAESVCFENPLESGRADEKQ
ncbi:hypothetical protein [Streptomyces coeruleorubidus]|uniref:hypothetical protein n=1 Tax=Streptomyces coeruleorubidus TaxID=116188 RepID=UPI0033FA7FB8